MDLPSGAGQGERPYVSTGHLPEPEPETVQSLLSDAHGRFKSNTNGQNSRVYPALASVPGDLFGLCVVGTTGRVYGAGDIDDHERVEAVRAEGNPDAGRSRQHHFRQQLPVAERDGEGDRHVPAGPGSGALEYRGARALKIGLLFMAGLALLAVIPAGQLPNYLPGEIPSDEPKGNDPSST
jgi:hypothetical protein